MVQPMLEFVLDNLEKSKGRLKEVADGSGVPYRTLEKIAQRKIKNPGINHVQCLNDYFSKINDR